jgi:hypothetical protein
MNIMAVADIIKALKMERNKLTIAALIARCSERLRGLSVHAIGRNQRRRPSAAVAKKATEAMKARPAEAGEIGTNPPISA